MKEEFSTQLGLVIFDPNLNGLKIRNFTVQNILLDDEGPCYGDGGGPLVASKGPNDESAVLFGIFSMDIDVWSNGTVRGCVNGITAVYTRVTKFLGWIRSHMEGTLQILLIRIFQTFVITTYSQMGWLSQPLLVLLVVSISNKRTEVEILQILIQIY